MPKYNRHVKNSRKFLRSPKEVRIEDPQEKSEYLNIAELASYIKRSKGAIRNLVLRRAIPYRKPAGRLLFIKEEIDEWVQMAPGKSLEEIQGDLVGDKETLKRLL